MSMSCCSIESPDRILHNKSIILNQLKLTSPAWQAASGVSESVSRQSKSGWRLKESSRCLAGRQGGRLVCGGTARGPNLPTIGVSEAKSQGWHIFFYQFKFSITQSYGCILDQIIGTLSRYFTDWLGFLYRLRKVS